MLKEMYKATCYKLNMGPTMNRMVKETSEKVSPEPSPEDGRHRKDQSYSRGRSGLYKDLGAGKDLECARKENEVWLFRCRK